MSTDTATEMAATYEAMRDLTSSDYETPAAMATTRRSVMAADPARFQAAKVAASEAARASGRDKLRAYDIALWAGGSRHLAVAEAIIAELVRDLISDEDYTLLTAAWSAHAPAVVAASTAPAAETGEVATDRQRALIEKLLEEKAWRVDLDMQEVEAAAIQWQIPEMVARHRRCVAAYVIDLDALTKRGASALIDDLKAW